MSKHESGFTNNMTNNAKLRELIESSLLEKNFAAQLIIIIIPDLTTDGVNPIIDMKNATKKKHIIWDAFLFILNKDKKLFKIWTIMAKWNPETAKKWKIPALSNQIFSFFVNLLLSRKKRARNKRAHSGAKTLSM